MKEKACRQQTWFSGFISQWAVHPDTFCCSYVPSERKTTFQTLRSAPVVPEKPLLRRFSQIETCLIVDSFSRKENLHRIPEYGEDFLLSKPLLQSRRLDLNISRSLLPETGSFPIIHTGTDADSQNPKRKLQTGCRVSSFLTRHPANFHL